MMVLAERFLLSLSLVIGRFRYVNCSLLEVRVLLVKLSPFADFVVVDKSIVCKAPVVVGISQEAFF